MMWFLFVAVCAGLMVFLGSGHAADVPSGQSARILGKVVAMPDTVAEIMSPATGNILSAQERPFTVGDRIEKGDAVVIMEHRYNLHDSSHLSTIRWDLLSAMLRARDAAIEARIARGKAERLLATGAVSGQQVQQLKAAELMAQADYDKQKKLLDQQDAQAEGSELVRRGLFAPISGEISFVNVTQGQIIEEGVLLYRIVNRTEVGFAARFPEAQFRRWDGKRTARIHFDTLPGKVFEGKSEVISPVVNPDSRTRDLLFRVKNTGGFLRFGMVGWLEEVQ